MATVLLIVDQDRAVADTLAVQLAAPPFAGRFNASVATTLEEALGAFEAQPVEVLVSDLNVAGTQLAEFARSRFPEIKVVFTADAPSADIESQVRSAAGLGLVVKPLRAENVVALLSAATTPPPPPEPVPQPAEPPAVVEAPSPPPPPPVPAAAPRVVAAAPKVVTKAPMVMSAPKVVAATLAATPPPAQQSPRVATVVAKVAPPAPSQPVASAPRAVVAKAPTVVSTPKVVAATPVVTPPPTQPPRAPTVVAKVAPPPSAPPVAAPAPRAVVAPPQQPGPTVMAKPPTVVSAPRVVAAATSAPPPPAQQPPRAPTVVSAPRVATAKAPASVATPPPTAQPPRVATVVAKVAPPAAQQPAAVARPPTVVGAPKVAATPPAQAPRAVAVPPQQPGPTVMAKPPTAVVAPKPVATVIAKGPPPAAASALRSIPTAPMPSVKPQVSATAKAQAATTTGPRAVVKASPPAPVPAAPPVAAPPPAPPAPEPVAVEPAPPVPEPPAVEPAPPASVPTPTPPELRAVKQEHEEPPPPVAPEFIPPPPPPRRASNPMIGAVLGPYSIKRLLGHGNWGSVFEAVQEQVNRTVAIKVLEPDLHEEPEKVAQFSALASRMANRRHNNLVAVYEAGESGGVHYYAREFIEGRTLQEIAESPQKLNPPHTLRVLMGVARALLYLTHHRIAIGPVPGKNVLVDNVNGEPHVCGFSFMDGTSGELGSSAATEMPQLAQMLWNALDPAAPQAPQVYALLKRLLDPDHPFPSLEHLLSEAETLEKSFHKPVVRKARSASSQRPALKPILPGGKLPLSQRLQKKHYIMGGAIAGVAALAVAGWFLFQQFTQLPPADVETFIHVPAGEFIYQNGEKKTTKEFWISKYEITIGQYRKFWTYVGEKGDKAYAHPKQPKDGDRTHTPADWDMTRAAVDARQPLEDGHPFTNDYPVFNVNYWDAYAYAKWAGGRLPTQEEWEKAARGTDGRLYPWGNSFDDPKRANTGKDYDAINRGMIDGYFRWAPVNAHPGDSSPFGVRDMAGNVCEWTDSWVPMKTAPKEQVPVICGGSWGDTEVRVTSRQTTVQPGQYHQIIGFRIVRDTAPPPAK